MRKKRAVDSPGITYRPTVIDYDQALRGHGQWKVDFKADRSDFYFYFQDWPKLMTSNSVILKFSSLHSTAI